MAGIACPRPARRTPNFRFCLTLIRVPFPSPLKSRPQKHEIQAPIVRTWI